MLIRRRTRGNIGSVSIELAGGRGSAKPVVVVVVFELLLSHCTLAEKEAQESLSLSVRLRVFVLFWLAVGKRQVLGLPPPLPNQICENCVLG